MLSAYFEASLSELTLTHWAFELSFLGRVRRFLLDLVSLAPSQHRDGICGATVSIRRRILSECNTLSLTLDKLCWGVYHQWGCLASTWGSQSPWITDWGDQTSSTAGSQMWLLNYMSKRCLPHINLPYPVENQFRYDNRICTVGTTHISRDSPPGKFSQGHKPTKMLFQPLPCICVDTM